MIPHACFKWMGRTRRWMEGTSASRLKAALRERWPSLVAFALPFLLYTLTATRTVQGGDTGEFSLVAARVGVPHPPGYPLYALLSRVFSLLIPVGSPAFRAAFLSALLGTLPR